MRDEGILGRNARGGAWALGFALLLASGCVAGVEDSSAVEKANGNGNGGSASEVVIDARRSLVATELPILERFSFERVMTQLADQSGVPGLTPTMLFRQWWDSQNALVDASFATGPHCDDESDPVLGTALNGYPYACRPAPAEGADAECDPFAVGSACRFIPVGLFNRFDLAPIDGAHCGEHRVVFARESGQVDARMRNLVIFEAILSNPHPGQGIKGCRKIVDFWADLTDEDDIDERADALEAFYFDGVANIEPVIDISHFGDNALGAGQVRTNQFMQPPGVSPLVWSLREFKLLRSCEGTACSAMEFVPVTAKTNPWGALLDPASSHPQAAAFRDQLVADVADLAVDDVGAIGLVVPDAFNSGVSDSSGNPNFLFADQLGIDPSPLRSAVQAELTAIGSGLGVDDIVARAQTQTCAGCHRFSSGADLGGGLTWPASEMRFTHVSERDPETVDGVTRFQISDALVDAFLPARKQVVEDYLNDKPKHPNSPHPTMGGRSTH